ncbi:hypothetical protein ACFL6X_07880 [Candidatus Latescibacterota bacterium]
MPPLPFHTSGRRIHVVGNTSAGKSTLGQRLAAILDVPFVELDAINWQPDWVGLVDTNPERFESEVAAATAADGWVVAGSYFSFSQKILWPRVQTVVWLDPPMPVLIWRVMTRSWRRWRTKELLWGTNYERFWPQLMLWSRQHSLIYWAVTQGGHKRRRMRAAMADPTWAHIRFVRLTSRGEVEQLVASAASNPQAAKTPATRSRVPPAPTEG